MHKLFRDTHLLLGLFLVAFVMMFGISSLRFSHHGWFDAPPTETEETLAVDAATVSSPRALARHLMESGGLRGELHRIQDDDGRISFDISRIGTVHDVEYVRGAAEAHVRTRVFPLMDTLTWMHGTFGVQHEYAPHNVWGALMLLTSVGLLVLGATGLYLWFQRRAERRLGSVLLVGNLAFGMVLIALIWVG